MQSNLTRGCVVKKEKPHHCRVKTVPVELLGKQVGPNQRLLPSSEGLTAAVEGKVP